MTPYKYTVVGDTTYFHYRFKELREWYNLGKSEGNTGMILTKRKYPALTYRGFGTFENPHTYVLTMMNWFPPFDGEPSTDDEIINPVKSECPFTSFRFTILDFNK